MVITGVTRIRRVGDNEKSGGCIRISKKIINIQPELKNKVFFELTINCKNKKAPTVLMNKRPDISIAKVVCR